MSGVSVLEDVFYSQDMDWSNHSIAIGDFVHEEEPVDVHEEYIANGVFHLPSPLVAVEAEDEIIELEVWFVMGCPYLAALMDGYDYEKGAYPTMKYVSIQALKVLQAWVAGELKAERIPWSDMEPVVITCDYLGIDQLLDEIADAQIIPRIHGEWYDIRARLLFTYERCQPDPDNWEFDPTMGLDFQNFIMTYYTRPSIESICNKLPRMDLSNFILSLGDHPCKEYLANKFQIGPII